MGAICTSVLSFLLCNDVDLSGGSVVGVYIELIWVLKISLWGYGGVCLLVLKECGDYIHGLFVVRSHLECVHNGEEIHISKK